MRETEHLVGRTTATPPVGEWCDAMHPPEIPAEVRHVPVAGPPGHNGHLIGAGAQQLRGALEANLLQVLQR